jgi:CxxC motif-containing protein
MLLVVFEKLLKNLKPFSEFLKLPAAKPMPKELRAELMEYLKSIELQSKSE